MADGGFNDVQSGEQKIRNFNINFGPQHPAAHGVLRLVLELDGEIVERCDPHIGLLHRGTEKLMESRTYLQNLPYFDRLDYVSMMAQEHAYSLAVEKLLNCEVPLRAQYIRVLFCEITRILNHLLAVGCHAMDVGAMTVFLYTFTEREKIYNFCEQLTGARFTTSYTRVGGQIRDIPEGLDKDILKFLDECENTIDEIAGLLNNNKIYLERMCDVGVISREDAISYGMTGPNLRASGVARDLRKDRPYLGYEKYDFDIPVGENGDCYDRFLVRMEEMRQSIKIIKQVLADFPEGEINVGDTKSTLPDKERVLMSMEELIHHFIVATQGIEAPEGEVYFAAENPKGELGFYIHSKGGGVPNRLKIRAPSFVNLGICADLLKGHMVSDIPAILGSLDFVMGECDR